MLKDEVFIMKCKYCGEEFEQNKRGRKKEYCSKIECIRKARNDANKKWYANKLKILKGSRNRIVEHKTQKTIVYSSTDRALNSLKNEDFTDVIELARELGAIRFKIQEKIRSYSPDQSLCDKVDQIFLHKLEELAKKDIVYSDEIIDTVKEHINMRQNRRVTKDKQEMLQHLIQGCISNPTEYVTEFIKKRDRRTYNPRIEERK